MCRYDRYQGGFDFHHLDPAEKDFSIAKVTKLHFGEAIFAELDKCALLCANCHREVHGGIATVPE
jgi:predicted HNH restriction endonuclease